MACINAPTLTPPSLPPGLSIGISTPPFSGNLALCCKIISFTVPPIPVPLGIPLDPAINAALASAITGIQGYLDQLQVKCPLE